MSDAPCPWVDLDEEGTELALEEFLSFQVTRLANTLQRLASREYLEPAGLTAPEWRILGFVRKYGPVQFAQVSEVTTLDKAQVSRSVKRLDALGLVKVDVDEGHAQRLVLAVTADGRRTFAKVLAKGARLQAKLLRELPPTQREALWQALHTLARAAGEKALPATRRTSRSGP